MLSSANRRQATSDRILGAVTELVTHEHPAAISVPAVAERAGVSVATVYRYFPTKSALLDAASEIGNQKTTARFERRAADGTFTDELVASSFWELADHLPLARNQQQSAAGRELRKRRRPGKRRRITKAMREAGIDPTVASGRRLAVLIELLASSTSLLELHDHLELPVDEAAAHVAWAVRELSAATRAEQGAS